jgi:hypothetical protein
MTSKTKRANTTGKKQRGTKAAATLIASAAPAEAKDATTITVSTETAGQPPATQVIASRPKANSKLGIVLGLLEEPTGASLDKLVEVTGWLPHTTRAALTGLRKRGFRIELQAAGDGAGSVYRVRSDAA